MRFLRFTTDAQRDLKENTSYHYSDLISSEYTKEYVSKMFGCNESDIEIVNNYYVQKLSGLCGYKLYAETLEEAIEEAIEISKNTNYSGDNHLVIYEGKYTDQTFAIDGDLFEASKILYQIKL